MAGNLESVIATLDAIDVGPFENDVAKRDAVIAAARRLLTRFVTPFERSFEIAWDQPALYPAVQVFIDLGIWEAWRKHGEDAISLDGLLKLATKDCDGDLLRRLLRILTVTSIVHEVGEDTYKPTPFSLALGDPDHGSSMVIQTYTNQVLPSATAFPSFLKNTNYRSPTDPRISAFSASPAGHGGQDFWAVCQQHPEYYASFVGFMKGWTRTKTHWSKFYPISERLVAGWEPTPGGAPLVVDVGGNVGLEVGRVLQALPDLPAGALVLQDLPEVIAMARARGLDDRIVAAPHDFFEPQPVRGARAYFLHAVLHDWSDEPARKILGNIRDAMTAGYSRLLIVEIVLPPTGANLVQAVMDIQMMMLQSSGERTERVWKELLAGVGFKIIQFWKDPRGVESVIEAEIA